MKLTLTLGLLLTGASIPVLHSASSGQDSADPLLGVVGGSAPATVRFQDDDLSTLRVRARELRRALDLVEREAELAQLERSIERRREARAVRREYEMRRDEIETEREVLEVELEAVYEDAERRLDQVREDLEAHLEAMEHHYQDEVEEVERVFELERMRAVEHAEDDDEAEVFVVQMEQDQHARLQIMRREFEESYEVARRDARDRIAAFTEEANEARAARAQRIQEMEREAATLEYAIEDHQDDSDAMAELEELRAEMEAAHERATLEYELEAVEERIELLECEDTDGDGPARAYFGDVAGDDLEDVFRALEHLQEQIDDLSGEVDALWKAVGKDSDGRFGMGAGGRRSGRTAAPAEALRGPGYVGGGVR